MVVSWFDRFARFGSFDFRGVEFRGFKDRCALAEFAGGCGIDAVGGGGVDGLVFCGSRGGECLVWDLGGGDGF